MTLRPLLLCLAAAPLLMANAQAGGGLELRLAGGGLTAGQPGLHPSGTYAFGMSRAEIVAAVSAIRGPATGEYAASDCGAGPMQQVRFGSLTLNIQNGRWVGWAVSGPADTPPLRTEWDLGLGSPRSALDDGDRDTAEVAESTLGTEFEVSEIGGLLSGAGPDATVTDLWAGTECAYR